MTLRQFQNFLSAQSEKLDTRIIFTLEAWGMKREYILRLPLKDAARKVSAISEALNNRKSRLEHFITIEGVEYGLHPKIYAMTTGEYIDLSRLNSSFWPDAHKAMAILYRPVIEKRGDKYKIEPYQGTELQNADKFLDLPLEIVDGFAAFFLTLAKESELTLTTYSIRKTTQALRETRGPGTGRFTMSLGAFWGWIKSLKSRFMTFLTT